MSFPLVEPQGRKELPAWGPTSDMMGICTWALAVLLHMAEGGVHIPEVEIQGVRASGWGGGARDPSLCGGESRVALQQVTGITVRHSAGKVQTGEGTGSAREATTTRTGTPASVEPQIELALSPFHVWWLVWTVTLACPATMLPRRGSGPLIRQHIQLRVWLLTDYGEALRRGKRSHLSHGGW